jgi:hypothetical protein
LTGAEDTSSYAAKIVQHPYFEFCCVSVLATQMLKR